MNFFIIFFIAMFITSLIILYNSKITQMTIDHNDNEWRNCDINNSTNCLNQLKKNGIIIIPNAIPNYLCDSVLRDSKLELKNKNKEIGEINEPINRVDVMLPINNNNKSIIKHIYKQLKPMWDQYTPNPVLVECSTFISFPKSKSQPWHRDTDNYKNDSKLISIGVALDDISPDMGPLEVFRGTNNNDLDIVDVVKQVGYNYNRMNCTKGSIIMWDSTVFHRGGANKSNKQRPVFYFSFMGNNGNKPKGATYSLKSKYGKNLYVKSL